MNVWKSDEKLLIFASLISPSKIILSEQKYQAFNTVFHHQMKHLNSLLSVSSGDEHCISCLIQLCYINTFGQCKYHFQLQAQLEAKKYNIFTFELPSKCIISNLQNRFICVNTL